MSTPAPEATSVWPKRRRRLLAVATTVFLIGWLIPERMRMPVAGATSADWNPASFWYYPWGRSGVHKGIDIFAPEGRPVLSATPGVVIFRGSLEQGGQVVLVLGPKWRLHYYAHLRDLGDRPRWLLPGSVIGSVGTTGNAMGKAPHLHYSVLSLIPLPWRYDAGPQGWRKMFYLDPGALLTR